MTAAKGEQKALFEDDPLDPEVAKVADRYVELIGQRDSIKERLEVQQSNLAGMLKKIGRTQVRHKKHIIEIVHKDEDKIRIRKVKEPRQRKKREQK